MTWGTTKQVSEKFTIPPSTVNYYAHKGILPCKRIGGRYKFPMDIIEKNFNKSIKDNANTKVW